MTLFKVVFGFIFQRSTLYNCTIIRDDYGVPHVFGPSMFAIRFLNQ